MYLDESCTKTLNDRANDELRAFYFYEAARNWCAVKNFTGGIKFFGEEAKSERKHFEKLSDFMAGLNVLPTLFDISKPPQFSSLKDILDKALEIETDLLDMYKKAYMSSFEEGELHVSVLLTEFVKIQTESVIEYNDLINQYNNYGDNLVALFDKDVLGK